MIHYIGYCAKVRDIGARRYTKDTIKEMYALFTDRTNKTIRDLCTNSNKLIGYVHAFILKDDGIKVIASSEVILSGFGTSIETTCDTNHIIHCRRAFKITGYSYGHELDGCDAKEC